MEEGHFFQIEQDSPLYSLFGNILRALMFFYDIVDCPKCHRYMSHLCPIYLPLMSHWQWDINGLYVVVVT